MAIMTGRLPVYVSSNLAGTTNTRVSEISLGGYPMVYGKRSYVRVELLDMPSLAGGKILMLL